MTLLKQKKGETAVEVMVAGPEHVPAILVLWEELASHHERLDPFYLRCEGATGNFETYIRLCIDSPDSLVLVCLDDDHVIGYANSSIQQHPPVVRCRIYGFIDNIVVAGTHRRRGAASLMLSRTLFWLAERGIDRVELNVSEQNAGGLEFWRSRGFLDFQRLMYREVPR